MKRVKVMLSAILVMAIVAGALAFKVKTSNVCAYTKIIDQGTPPATTVCDRVGEVGDFQTIKTTTAASTEYALTVPRAASGPNWCPDETKANCPQSRTLTAE